MNFALTEEQKMIQKMVREFTEKEVAPLDEKMDKTGEFPYELMKKMSDNGFYGIPYAEAYGGAGGDEISGALTLMELAKGSMSVAFTLATHWVPANAIYNFGTEEQKQKYLVPMMTEGKLGAFALTEPGAGSDSAGIVSTGTQDGDTWILNGNKVFITNGGVADIFVICVKTDKTKGAKGISTFIVEKGTPGFSIGKKEDKMGIRASSTAELIMKDCRVPKENMIGNEGEGFKIAMSILEKGRLAFGALGIGISEACLSVAKKYANERQAFGKPIASFQAIQFIIADMAMEIELAKALMFKVAYMYDTGEKCGTEAAMLKVFTSEMAMKASKNAIQVLGGYGYTRDYAPERYLRDSKFLEIGEGANEVLRFVIGGAVLRG